MTSLIKMVVMVMATLEYGNVPDFYGWDIVHEKQCFFLIKKFDIQTTKLCNPTCLTYQLSMYLP